MAELPDGPSGGGGTNIEEQLRRLNDAVAVPAHSDYVVSVRRRLEDLRVDRSRVGSPAATRRGFRPLLVAGLVLSLVFVATVSIPDARRAVADLFGLRGVRVLPQPSPTAARTTIDPDADFGTRVTLSEARAAMAFEIALPSAPALAQPDRVYISTGRGLESVTLVYRPRPGLPEVLNSDVGLIVSEYAGEAAPYFDKYVDQQHPPTPVTVDGVWPGLQFARGQDVLIHGPGTTVYSENARTSAPALVWQEGDLTYRLEANIDTQRALQVAAALD